MQTMVRGHTIKVWSSAYQFCARGPSSASFRCSLPSRSWGSQHGLPPWFLWRSTIGGGEVPLSDQYWCFCPYASVFGKDSCDQLLATSLSQCAYFQEGHPSLCYCDEDTFLSVQAHFAHYARGSWWDEHQFVLWVFDHSHLPSVCDRHFWFWAQITDSRSSWLTDFHEVQCSVAAWRSRRCSLASTSSGWHISSFIIITGRASFLRHWSYFSSVYVFHGSWCAIASWIISIGARKRELCPVYKVMSKLSKIAQLALFCIYRLYLNPKSK
jgi:hypothetical protein